MSTRFSDWRKFQESRHRPLTMNRIAEITGLSVSSLYYLERGTRSLGPARAALMARQLGTRARDLCDYDPAVLNELGGLPCPPSRRSRSRATGEVATMSRNDERPRGGGRPGGHHTDAILARQRLGAEARRLAIARLAEQAIDRLLPQAKVRAVLHAGRAARVVSRVPSREEANAILAGITQRRTFEPEEPDPPEPRLPPAGSPTSTGGKSTSQADKSTWQDRFARGGSL